MLFTFSNCSEHIDFTCPVRSKLEFVHCWLAQIVSMRAAAVKFEFKATLPPFTIPMQPIKFGLRFFSIPRTFMHSIKTIHISHSGNMQKFSKLSSNVKSNHQLQLLNLLYCLAVGIWHFKLFCVDLWLDNVIEWKTKTSIVDVPTRENANESIESQTDDRYKLLHHCKDCHDTHTLLKRDAMNRSDSNYPLNNSKNSKRPTLTSLSVEFVSSFVQVVPVFCYSFSNARDRKWVRARERERKRPVFFIFFLHDCFSHLIVWMCIRFYPCCSPHTHKHLVQFQKIDFKSMACRHIDCLAVCYEVNTLNIFIHTKRER